MNDFTKEELEDLVFCINELYKKATINPRISFALKDKLQSMIDNHCDHKYYLQGCGDAAFAQCVKCGQVSKVIANDNQ